MVLSDPPEGAVSLAVIELGIAGEHCCPDCTARSDGRPSPRACLAAASAKPTIRELS